MAAIIPATPGSGVTNHSGTVLPFKSAQCFQLHPENARGEEISGMGEDCLAQLEGTAGQGFVWESTALFHLPDESRNYLQVRGLVSAVPLVGNKLTGSPSKRDNLGHDSSDSSRSSSSRSSSSSEDDDDIQIYFGGLKLGPKFTHVVASMELGNK